MDKIIVLRILRFAIPVFLGAFIGFITNWVALKMLFRPFKPKYFLGFRIPFTPGIIPKNQKRLSGAIAQTIANDLLSGEEIAKRFNNDLLKRAITDKLTGAFFDNGEKLNDIFQKLDVDGETITEKMSDVITQLIIDEVGKVDMTSLVSNVVDSFAGNDILSMFISPYKSTIVETLNLKVREFVSTQAFDMLKPLIHKRLIALSDNRLDSVLNKVDINKEAFEKIAYNLLDYALNSLGSAFDNIDIKKIVQDKMDTMPLDEFEKMINNVVHRELRAVENLGWVLGGIIGLLNAFNIAGLII